MLFINLLILALIVAIRAVNEQLAYAVGSVYVGTLVGFALYVRSDLEGMTIDEAVRSLLRKNTRYGWIKGDKSEYFVILGMSALLIVITLIGDYRFFGHALGDNRTAALIGMGIAGAVYAFFLMANDIWFDLLIWQGKLMYDVIAVMNQVFLLVIVIGVSSLVVPTPFFAAGLVSRAVTSFILYRLWQDMDKYFSPYLLVGFALLVPVIYRLWLI